MDYNLGQACVTNWGSFVLLQIRASFVTTWGSYYKLGQPLLQNRAAVINWGKVYYKLGQVLQIRAIITNWGLATTNKRPQTATLTHPTKKLAFHFFFPHLVITRSTPVLKKIGISEGKLPLSFTESMRSKQNKVCLLW